MNRHHLLVFLTFYLLVIFFIFIISCVVTIYRDEPEKIINPSIPTAGLIAYYPFNGNANDFSENGLNGSIIPGIIPQASITSDRNGEANKAFYTGTGYVQVLHNNLLNLQNFTISAWIRMEGTDYAFNCFIGKDYDSNFSIGIISGGSMDCAAAVTRSMRVSINGSSLLFSNFSCYIWYHITVTYEYSTGAVQLYVNGSYMGSGNVPPNYIMDNTYNLGIGQDGLNSDHFSGIIDEVCIYNRILTLSEINTLYTN